ncbi:UNVERIFIED_CONTAM: UDP-glycosyltransferase 88B1 [Sesamum latifolium]|uniref:Glycosyltransferase n=1 Tax=Sesamum latifolium TaxID=2727402 RepID=A0AAW2T714_9LAMI
MGAVVLYPSPVMSHLIALVELGKLILHHRPSFSVHILIVLPSYNTGSTAAYVRHISATVPSLTFHHLPPISLELDSFPSPHQSLFEVLHRSNPHVRRILESISLSATISAIVIDMFCTCALPIAAELNIPYYVVTCGACDLAVLLHFPTLHNATTKTGIIVNTFESLETKSLKAIREGRSNPGGHTPPVFPVGPLLASEDRHDCLNWLDKQPSNSVVFLCFGSLGLFSAAQLKEIAVGLERSGQRFLWVVRSPPSDDKSKRFLPPPEPDLDSLLPAGFLDRTKDRGLVLKSWAPQVAVLNHESVGGFVTHCGWNSVLEAVWAAVPMVTWPLYAEQKMNRVVLVEELKVALRLEVAEDGFVAAEEVERRLRELMGSEKGREIRKVVEEKSVEARAAMREGGSSIAAIGKLVELWERA